MAEYYQKLLLTYIAFCALEVFREALPKLHKQIAAILIYEVFARQIHSLQEDWGSKPKYIPQ